MHHRLKQFISSMVKAAKCLEINRQGKEAVILLYHSVGKEDINDYLKLRINPETFEEQMKFLCEKKYSVVSLTELINNLNYKTEIQNQKFVSITFDDGYVDNLKFAVPTLKKYGFPATIFVTTDYLSGRNSQNNYWEKWEYLTTEKLKELVSSDIEIGSHSCSHRVLTAMDNAIIRNEILSSKKVLEDITQKNIISFSYPHGIFNKRIKRILREEGYLSACTSITGFNDNKSDLFELKRIEIRSDDSLDDFKNKLKGCYNWLGYFQKIRFKFQYGYC